MDSSSVRQQAIQWLVKLQTVHDVDYHWPDFEAWLAEDPSHLQAYTTVERIWSDLKFLSHVAHRKESHSPRAMMQSITRETRRRHIRVCVGLTAFVFLIAGATTLLIGLTREHLDKQPPWVSYERGADQLTPFSLEDGSVVQLNDNTHIHIRMSESTREVLLDNGEAYFDVKPQRGRPFDIDAGPIVIFPLGAEFTVKKEGNGYIETVVRRGVVNLQPDARQAGSRSGELPAREVKAGEIAMISPSRSIAVEAVDPTEMEHRLAWITRVIHLDDTSSRVATAPEPSGLAMRDP